MLKNFLPDEFVENVLKITPEMLLEKGVKGVITDLDNTLVAWDRPDATPEIIEWLTSLKKAGLEVTIVSNNNELRVKAFSEPIDMVFVSKANKPLTSGFKRALKLMQTKRSETVVIGDQLITDILGGNRAGMHTILVIPVATNDAKITTFNRNLERFIMNRLRRRGLVYWEE